MLLMYFTGGAFKTHVYPPQMAPRGYQLRLGIEGKFGDKIKKKKRKPICEFSSKINFARYFPLSKSSPPESI